jgi:hypothetical protein
MALSARSFWFVLLLLAGDWYFDTSHGLSPFEGPLCSTAVACRSLVYKQQLCKRFDATDLAQPAPPLAVLGSHNLPLVAPVPSTSPHTLSGPSLACFLMSFQC